MGDFIKNILTSADNSTYSMSKIIGLIGSMAMISDFVKAESIDFQGLGIGLATIIAAFAAKAMTDTKPEKTNDAP